MRGLRIIHELVGGSTERIITTDEMNAHTELRQLLARFQDDGSAGTNRRILRELVADKFLWNDTSVAHSGRYKLMKDGRDLFAVRE